MALNTKTDIFIFLLFPYIRLITVSKPINAIWFEDNRRVIKDIVYLNLTDMLSIIHCSVII